MEVQTSLQSASERKIVSCHESDTDSDSESESSKEEDNFEDLNYLRITDISNYSTLSVKSSSAKKSDK